MRENEPLNLVRQNWSTIFSWIQNHMEVYVSIQYLGKKVEKNLGEKIQFDPWCADLVRRVSSAWQQGSLTEPILLDIITVCHITSIL